MPSLLRQSAVDFTSLPCQDRGGEVESIGATLERDEESRQYGVANEV